MAKNRTKKLPRVLILYTGGTFGMEVPRGGTRVLRIPKLSALELRRRLHRHVPELHKLAHCDVDIAANCDSAHVGPAEWILFADRIRDRWENYDGVVVLHGTDTLAYTACALSFLLRPCRKPVVITGAQRPLAALRSDARRNLISAVEIAATGPRKIVQQVTVFFDDRLFQGNRVRKMSASEFSAFDSPQAPPLAIVGTSTRFTDDPARVSATPSLEPRFNPQVVQFTVTPGFPAALIEDTLLPNLDALVLQVYSTGTAPTHDPDFIRLLRSARARGIPVLAVTESTTRTPGDHAVSNLSYDAARQLLSEGVLWSGEMTPECAYVKTSLILGQPDFRPRRQVSRFGSLAARHLKQFKKLWTADLASEGTPKP